MDRPKVEPHVMWQLIETAPKDGTQIDVWEFCHDPVWRPDQHGIAAGMRVTNVKWLDGEWKQYDDYWGEWLRVGNEHYTVSHWTPIPGVPGDGMPSVYSDDTEEV